MTHAGFPLEPEWFASHFEFRFPRIGAICQRGVQLELRKALEPWHVLGEQPAEGAMARYVDSSVERLQVKVSGFTHRALCRDLQWLPGAVASDRPRRRIRGGRPVPGVAASQLPAPHAGRRRSAGVRSRRPVAGPLRRRLPIPCRPSGRPQPDHVSGQCPGSRESPDHAVPRLWAHSGSG